MAETVQIISDPTWWITVVMVGILMNLVSGFIQNAFWASRKHFGDVKAFEDVTGAIGAQYNKFGSEFRMFLSVILGTLGTVFVALSLMKPNRVAPGIVVGLLGFFLLLAGILYFENPRKIRAEATIYPKVK